MKKSMMTASKRSMTECLVEKDVGRIGSDPHSMMGSFIWTIDRYFHLPQQRGFTISSPVFYVMNTGWHLTIIQTAVKPQESLPPTVLSLQMSRNRPSPVSRKISLKLGIRGRGGRDILTYSDEKDFSRDDDTVSYADHPPLYQQNRDLLAPWGNLTVFCQLRGEDAAFQAEAPHSLRMLGQDMRELFLRGRNTDLTLKVGDQQLQVHKAVLGARSVVFAAMVEHDMAERRSGVVDIVDSDPNDLRDFLLHLYSGTVEERRPETDVLQLYRLADKYCVENLKAEYLHVMRSNLSVRTFCDVAQLALQHDETELLRCVIDFFSRNLREVTLSYEWYTFVRENPDVSSELYAHALRCPADSE